MTTRAEQLFKQIMEASSPTGAIQAMIDSQQQESEFLEFKGGDLNAKEARRYWSKALSGFANTEGGVLIWGVDARKTPSADDPELEIDAACGAVYVPNATDFAEKLSRQILQATIDPVTGSEIRAFPVDQQSGFVVCFIPQGKHPPYRADLDESHNYFHRVRDSFAVISHTWLRVLFHPRLSPSFKVDVDFAKSSTEDTVCGLVTLNNRGVATARDISIFVGVPSGWTIDDVQNLYVDGSGELSYTRDVRTERIIESPSDLHLGQSAQFCNIRWGHKAYSNAGRAEIRRADLERVRFVFIVYCLDTPPQANFLEFSVDEINDRTPKTIQLADWSPS